VEARVLRGREAIERYQWDGTIIAIPAYDAGNEAAGMFLELDYYAPADRGAVPEGATRWLRSAGSHG
jgi:uncharacterized protein